MSEPDPGSAVLEGDIAPAQQQQLDDYLDLLERWNATYNLTAVRERDAMRTQHLADCLALLPPLLRHKPAGRLLDVGSGGGLPGVVVAVAAPRWQVVCADKVAKKAAFIRQVAGALRLTNLSALHGRVERLQPQRADVITARAFSTLAELAQLTRTHLAPGGVWVAMKGRVPDEEIAALPTGVSVFHVEQLEVPGLDAKRCLIWMRPDDSP